MNKGIEISNYEIAEHLKTEEDIQLYLEEVMKEDNPALILSALGDIAKARNMSQLAKEVGISREGLYKALSGKGNPTFTTILKIVKALGLRFELQSANVNI
ncbi:MULTISPECIES: addiction module antidote protein [Photorhabdus]|uniref:addiction module antidote protein n=1 Tax=Photorhabdus TaxID=29487 RepID=UPI000DCB1ECC|nr:MULTISPECIES: addiction module antidote protein [Photorhabdus]MCT8344354.1 putative addiction module antidote protein [Photorhabdus kleinii]RAW93884.1 putative addiction module antidote protein [Photorhabdus sp. S9-53]RAW93900.1 putative addiction module antidote protein [Photorhabdus sp. S10-54]RAW97643.1 putative addiction module antidote protein [Photorhabdus sp. S8-52]